MKRLVGGGGAAPAQPHLLQFVDIFMTVKCCVEHGELRDATAAAYALFPSASMSLTAGSLLAAVREDGFFIPWDTDVDLLLQPSDESRVAAVLRANEAAAGATKKDRRVVTKLIDPPLAHDHGRLLGYVYGTPAYRHAEASRVEIWVALESKKMQRRGLVLPLRPCRLQGVAAMCPARAEDVLLAGYGERWCVRCKARSSNCKS